MPVFKYTGIQKIDFFFYTQSGYINYLSKNHIRRVDI